MNTEPGQNRIVLPKARIKNAIQGIAIGNPVKIKVNQKLRNASSDSDKSTNDQKTLPSTSNLPNLQPKPDFSPPPVWDENLTQQIFRKISFTNSQFYSVFMIFSLDLGH